MCTALQRLIEVVNNLRVLDIVKVVGFEQPLLDQQFLDLVDGRIR